MGWKQTGNEGPRVWRKGGDDQSQAAGVPVWSFHSVMVWANCFIRSGDVGDLQAPLCLPALWRFLQQDLTPGRIANRTSTCFPNNGVPVFDWSVNCFDLYSTKILWWIGKERGIERETEGRKKNDRERDGWRHEEQWTAFNRDWSIKGRFFFSSPPCFKSNQMCSSTSLMVVHTRSIWEIPPLWYGLDTSLQLL